MESQIEALEVLLHAQAPLIEISSTDILTKAESGLQAMVNILARLKEITIHHHFKTNQDEIRFFKRVKPLYVSRLVYYDLLFQIESRKPKLSSKVQRKYYEIEQRRLLNYFRKHKEFYNYYRSESSHLDDKYFLRNQVDIRLAPGSSFYVIDHRFSTSHDFMLAKLMAHEQVYEFLEKTIHQLLRPESSAANNLSSSTLEWTETKSALVELIYALHSQGAIKSQQAGIKDIAHVFESLFKIELGDYYRTFLDIRMRKTGRTKFIESLRDQLLKKMDEKDF